MFGRKRVKIPRIPSDYRYLAEMGMGKIEIYPSTEEVRGVSPPILSYEIKAKALEGSQKERFLAEISVRLTKSKKRGSKAYRVSSGFRDLDRPDYVSAGKRDNLGDATMLAHQAAVKLANKIADINNLPLEDRISESEKELEDRKLAHEIDSLPRKIWPFGIFALLIIAGLALSLGSFTTTGNAISNLTGTTSSLLGIIFFIVGLTGLFFSFKRK